MRRGSLLALALALVGASTAQSAFAQGAVRGGPLPQLFPSTNWWNTDVSAAPVDAGSPDYIAFIGNDPLHPDFGGDAAPPPSTDIYGMVHMTVPGTQALEQVAFVEYPGESDPGAPGRPPGYPIPLEARTEPRWIEGGAAGGGQSGDRHMLIVDRDNLLLFELYHTHWNPALSRWEAGSGAAWSLLSNARRPEGWTSADAAGLAILPGLVRYDEAYGPGPIPHAFRFTVRATDGHVFPASHTAGSTTGAPPMGTRLRLKASVDIAGFPDPVRKIFQALKTYGLILADNGSDMYIQGGYDTRWDNDILNPAFASLNATDFEMIQLGWQPPVTDLIFRDGFDGGP